MSIIVREAVPESYFQLVDVIDKWFGESKAQGQYLHSFIHFPQTTLLAYIGEKLVGFACGYVSQKYKYQAYLRLIVTDPNYRRAGIGRVLYEHFFENCKKLGAEEVRCTISTANICSIAFHESVGFKRTPSRFEAGVPATENFDKDRNERLLYVKALI